MPYTEKKDRHIMRGLRHKLIGSPSEIEKYEKEVAAHLENDKQDETMSAATEGLATKTPAPAKK